MPARIQPVSEATEDDLCQSESAGADLVFVPPSRRCTHSEFDLHRGWQVILEGAASRPGTLSRGVATVVLKLLQSWFSPTLAVFGQKDYQQQPWSTNVHGRRSSRTTSGSAMALTLSRREPTLPKRNRYLNPQDKQQQFNRFAVHERLRRGSDRIRQILDTKIRTTADHAEAGRRHIRAIGRSRKRGRSGTVAGTTRLLDTSSLPPGVLGNCPVLWSKGGFSGVCDRYCSPLAAWAWLRHDARLGVCGSSTRA